MQEELKKRALELLKEKKVDCIIGWRKGLFDWDLTPSMFRDAADFEKNFVYNDFSAANLSKYLVKMKGTQEKFLLFLKPCDTYSFTQLLKEHRIDRDKAYVIGIPCTGKIDIKKMKKVAGEDILSAGCTDGILHCKTLEGVKEYPVKEMLSERCLNCKSGLHVTYDELIGEEGEVKESGRFDMVEKIEAMTPEQRFEFWRGELSRCIRCNACRDVCPACTCEHCIFDNEKSGFDNKAAADSFEENMFHIIRAFHVAGRCTDCGECSRVCPEGIPIHLLNRKVIKDINNLFGEYQAGSDLTTVPPLTNYLKQDPEPSLIRQKEEEKDA